MNKHKRRPVVASSGDAIGSCVGPRRRRMNTGLLMAALFIDRRNTGGATTNAKVKAATAELTLAFFDWIFESDGTALMRWQDRRRFLLAPAPSLKSPSLPDFGGADQETGTSRQR